MHDLVPDDILLGECLRPCCYGAFDHLGEVSGFTQPFRALWRSRCGKVKVSPQRGPEPAIGRTPADGTRAVSEPEDLLHGSQVRPLWPLGRRIGDRWAWLGLAPVPGLGGWRVTRTNKAICLVESCRPLSVRGSKKRLKSLPGQGWRGR